MAMAVLGLGSSVGVASDLLAGSLGANSLGVSLLIVSVTCSVGSAALFYLASRSIEQDLPHSPPGRPAALTR